MAGTTHCSLGAVQFPNIEIVDVHHSSRLFTLSRFRTLASGLRLPSEADGYTSQVDRHPS